MLGTHIQGNKKQITLQKIKHSFQKYTFGFRVGENLHKALDESEDMSLKDATVSSLKDTAKSTGNIYVSRTFFSYLKITFLESALGSAIMSSTLMVWVKSLVTLILSAFSKTALGVLFTSFTATITFTFTGISTALLTILAGTTLGRLIASTTVGSYIFNVSMKLIPMIGSVIPYLLGTVVVGYLFRRYKGYKNKGVDEENTTSQI